MVRRFDAVVSHLESKFSDVIEDKLGVQNYDLVHHVRDIDKDLYKYIIVKSNNDITNRRILANESIIGFRNAANAIRFLDYRNKELEKKIAQLEKMKSSIGYIKYIHIGFSILFAIVVIWVLAAVDKDAGNTVIDLLKEAGNLFKSVKK